MSVTNYHTLNGKIRGETTKGVRTNYLSDALGSVTGTTSSTVQLLNSYRHKPYGTRLSKSGVASDSSSSWVGQAGYRNKSRSFASHYIRARHYVQETGTWSSIDLIWPSEPKYVFGLSNPTTFWDASGFETSKGCCEWKFGCYHIPLSSYGKKTACAKMMDALRLCGITDIEIICRILGKGECERAAFDAGVDPAILCGAMLNEYAGPSGKGPHVLDPQDPAAKLLIPSSKNPLFPSTASVGCAGMQPRHAQNCIDRLRKCNPSLYAALGPLPTTALGMARKLAINCSWSLKVAAACMYVETHRECGGTSTPMTFPITWNPGAFPKDWPRNAGKDYYPKRAKCIIEALKATNPFWG